MINLISNKLIYRPVKQVFDFISIPENDFQWQYGILKSAQISDGGIAVGTFFRSIGHFMGRRFQGTFEVTEYEPNKRYGLSPSPARCIHRPCLLLNWLAAPQR